MNFYSLLIYFLVLLCSNPLSAQASKTKKNKPQNLSSLAAPEGVAASDGLSPDYIDIKWTARGGGITYRIYRSDNPSVVGTEITAKPQIVGFFRDGDRLVLRQGRRYYYRVKALSNNQESAYSLADAGFLKAIAGGHDSTELSATQLIDLQKLELEIRPLERDTFQQGEIINVRYVLVNKGNTPLSNLTVRFTTLAKNVWDGNELDVEIEKITNLQAGESHRGVAILPTKTLHADAVYDLTLWANEKTAKNTRIVIIK